ncbi:MAG TPA: transporter substrate-binding protein, partial [Anaerolineales bacterium]|nr:transporter substrate-binding protein [Anaerolineales bacterium]
MAISETSLRDVLLFTFDEINAKGGVLGKKIEAVVVDGASDWPLFAEKAKQLLEQDKVAATFGCWTSVSRKSVLPVFEKNNGLLFYPVQYEGEELSKNIFYTAEAVNQQASVAMQATTAMNSASHQLTESMDSVSAVVEENTAATEQMAAGSIEVAHALENVAAVGQENGRAVADVAQAASGIAGQVESVASSAAQLAQLAEGLKQIVHQFKIKEDDAVSIHAAFETFKQAHRGWVERAQKWIDGSEPLPTEIPDHTRCPLGRWHNGRSALEHGHLVEFKALEEPHERFHRALNDVSDRLRAGQTGAARSAVEALARASRDVVAALDRLEAAVLG